MNQRLDRSAPAEGDEINDGQQAVNDAEAARQRLEDPQRQKQIENPEELRYTLNLTREREATRDVDGETLKVIEEYPVARPIRIRIAFTPRDVQKRGVLDMIEGHYRMVSAELIDLTGDPAPNLYDYMQRRPAHLEAALCMPACRSLARKVVVAMAYPDPDAPEFAREPITLEQVSEGMDSSDILAFQLALIVRFVELVWRAKKARGPQPSGKPKSTRSSRKRTAGPATTSSRR